MSNATEQLLAARRALDRSREIARTGWYHSFELPEGRHIEGLASVEALRARVAQMPVPTDLRGKRVLDIGAWDGWFSFEMERRGAEVVAVDCIEVPNFLYIREQLGSKVGYRVMDVYDLSPQTVGRFDIVLFLGVLYHLKHPLLALEKVCALTRELAIVDSFVTDFDADWAETAHDLPRMEFYETDELGGQLDNWFGPNLACLLALCRTAGFARVSALGHSAEHASVACYRRWEAETETGPIRAGTEAPRLTAAVHYRNYGLNFHSDKDDYILFWFDTAAGMLERADVMPEVGGYGTPALAVRQVDGNHWQANALLPPGLEPGWHPARLRLSNTGWSEASRIAVDFPSGPCVLTIDGACDSTSATPGRIQLRPESHVSVWVTGLPENADCHLVRAYLDGTPLAVVYVAGPEQGPRQVNARLPNSTGPGSHDLCIEVQGSRSAAFPMLVEDEPGPA